MIIIDASVVYKWYDFTEPNTDEASVLLTAHIDHKERLHAPELILYELTNAWVTKTKLSIRRAKLNLQSLEDANIRLEAINFKRLSQAMLFANKYKVAVYDAIYAVLAKEKKCDLITADEKFVAQVKLPFIKLLQDYV